MTRTKPLEHYTDTDDVPDHVQARNRIRQVLTNEARGRDNAISSTDLAERTPVSSSTVRDLIPEVRERWGIPIGSCPSGYFVIESADVFERQVERQLAQAERSKETARAIARAWNGNRISND